MFRSRIKLNLISSIAACLFLCGVSFGSAHAEDIEQENSDLESTEWEAQPNEAPYASEELEEEASSDVLDSKVNDTKKVNVPAKAPVVVMSPKTKSAKGTKLIHHPLTSKGLKKINKDGSYIYRTELGKKNKAFNFKITSMAPPDIEGADASVNYSTMYGGSNILGFNAEYEWQPFNTFGKLGVFVGGGLTYSQGNGHFVTNGAEAKEKYTLLTFPMTAGGIYRFEYSDKQWLAPYLSGGLAYIGMMEQRDDGKSPKLVGAPAVFGSGGVMFNITSWDQQLSYDMFSEYGVSAMWAILEYRRLQSFSKDLDYSGDLISFGFAADY